MTGVKKKLIEVALPLEAINIASAREKSIRHGHPSTLHLWWARRPLAACRAVLFAQLVDDPSSHPEEFPSEEDQEQERKRLFEIIENLVKWENSNNEQVLAAARAEILKSCDGDPPAVLDPFCGGGSIPLEAQRLGLKAYASDLNPVAVLITKALIEIPPKFANKPPINPESRKKMIAGSYRGAQGLAEDVRYYGKWMRDEAERLIGHLFPKIKVTPEMAKGRDDLKHLVGQELKVIAWLWARTVKCPNPACGAMMPLVRSFALSNRKGQQAWVEAIGNLGSVRFDVRTKGSSKIAGTINRKGAVCIACKSPVSFDHIREEAQAHAMAAKLMAVVAEGAAGRAFLPPTVEQETMASKAQPKNVPETSLPQKALGFRVQAYGLTKHRDLFSARQLVALTTFSDLVAPLYERVLNDARAAGMCDDPSLLADGGLGSSAYAQAVAMYAGLAISKAADLASTLCHWQPNPEHLKIAPTFSRHALPMSWDFAEGNPFSGSSGSFFRQWELVSKLLAECCASTTDASVQQLDAMTADGPHENVVFATDPPYYDNISYADLSDFFYVWLRRSVGTIFPQLFSTLLVPKAQELIATPFRFEDSKEKARRFFEEGIGKALAKMREAQNRAYPLTLFYAFKQTEADEDEGDTDSSGGVTSTGWETMLEGLMKAGFQISGTWPMRTERPGRMREAGSNALASSIVLACRPRAHDAPLATRREFVNALRNELPEALKTLQHGSIAPVDLAQAAIGPGMAVFSRYSKVLETDGSPMRVRTALGLINQALDEILAEQEGEYDAETRWALAWFEQYSINEGKFGDAETLSRAKDTAVNALEEAGIIKAKAGKVQLVPRDSLSADWDPTAEARLTVWELTQHLIRALETGGEAAAARIIRRVGSLAETAKDLAYRLYVICDHKGWSQEALSYNMLVKSWPELQKLAAGREGESATLL
jgi:putative DNA methylase